MIFQADARRLPLADQSVDIVFGSPPYMDARTYGIDAQRKCAEWIDWILAVTKEACRVSRGLVLWVVGGVTRKWCYWPGPEGLLYRWWAAGGQCWRPCYWHRVGIPGSGGKQWLRADVEYVLAFKGSPGPVPWADNTSSGHPPKWGPGGEMSYRDSHGTRRNQWGGQTSAEETNTAGSRRQNGRRQKKGRPSHRLGRRGDAFPPVLANPGNIIHYAVGGGVMGSRLCHLNEAPFSEALCEFFIRGWCPPGGIVLDPFSGSGTTASVAKRLGRRFVACDLRESQCRLTERRVDGVTPPLMEV